MQHAKARSSHQLLLMTWGYVNGDGADQPAIFPDYRAMQVRLANCAPISKQQMPLCVPLQLASSLLGIRFCCKKASKRSCYNYMK